ncbi:hypothetical protein [Acinetobacter soli]|uniref:hypothetical protein n=1 Tax=Acinetobacter soli TaxID=487316 RepID=UPI0013C32B10|nr:hypothetical protein [Acinetobacter soli]
MDKCREEFEKTRTFKEFNARSPVVFSNFGGYVSAEDGRPQVYLNGALASWQEQQKRIDELQKQLIDQGQRFNENTQKIADAEYKNRQLQSRMDAANAVIHEYYTGSYQESPDLVVDLEQALKGGEV